MADTPIPNPTWLGGILTRLGIPRLGTFFLSDRVFPVSIVDSGVSLLAQQVLPSFGTPSSAGELVAPAALTRLADTGQLAAGTYTFTCLISRDTAADAVRLQRRNAADAADIWAFRFQMTVNGNVIFSFRTAVALNERVVLTCIAGGAGTYQGSIFVVAG